MSNYPIRKLTIDDYDNLIDLWVRAELSHRPKGRDKRESMIPEFARVETAILGMFDGDKLIGSVVATSDGRKGWINRLAVDPEYRRRGLGIELIKASEDFLHGLGLQIIAALIENYNKPSLAAFEKAGYKFTNDIIYCTKRHSQDT